MATDTEKAKKAIEILDTLLIALSALPGLIAAASGLVNRLKSGEPITQDELDDLQARIEARNARIQDA
jgi:hypothetical protein